MELTDLRHPGGELVKMDEIKQGDQIEFSPMAVAVVMDIAKRLAEDASGAALLIDYGHDFLLPDSLRGIRGHEFVSSLEEPGQTDLVLLHPWRHCASKQLTNPRVSMLTLQLLHVSRLLTKVR